MLCVACRSPPNIYFKKKKTGGVSINSTLQLTKMDDKLIQRILQEYKIHNCEVGLCRLLTWWQRAPEG